MGKISYRRVPDNWEHPRDEHGCYIPLYNGMEFVDHSAQYQVQQQKWEEGLCQMERAERLVWEPIPDDAFAAGMEVYYGRKPVQEDYTPIVTAANLTDGAWQVYEEVSPGTPMTRVYPNFDALVQAVVDASECPEYAARAKIVCTILKGWWYVSVKDFMIGGSHYQGNATCS